MNKIPIEPGRVAMSKMGRDAGGRFVVLRVLDDFAWIADGCLRKSETPKRKKQKHLRATPEFFPSIAEMLQDGKIPSNAELRKRLADRPRED